MKNTLNCFLSLLALPVLAGICSYGNPAAAPSERTVFLDSLTGAEIWQISAHDSMSNMPYFEVQAFTDDDEYVIFKSWREEGIPRIFRSRMSDGVVSKVSDREVPHSYSIGPDGEEVWFLSGTVIYAVNVKTLAERVLFDATETAAGRRVSYSTSFTNDGKYTVFACGKRGEPMDIYRVFLPDNTVEKVFTYPTGFSHPLIHPEDPNLINFVPYPDLRIAPGLSDLERARNWIVYADRKEGRPFLVTERIHRTTHETWSTDGRRFYFFRKGLPGTKNVDVCSIDKNGQDLRIHYSHPTVKLGHGVSSRDGKWFVADAQDPYTNPLFLINLETGRGEIICWPNSTQAPVEGNPQEDHVHPSFSRSGKYIAFTSDRGTGTPQAFVIPIEKFVK